LASPTPSTWSLDSGRIIIGERLRGGTTSDVVHLASRADDPDERCLVTLTTKHAESYDRLRTRFELAFEGIAPLAFLGPTDPGTPFSDALAERLPPGHPVAPRLSEPVLARLGAAVASILARVHAAGGVINGIRPELMYVDDAQRLTTIVPRGPGFAASAPMKSGMRTYHVPYFSPEQFLANQVSPASDVFALCATVFFLATGTHPFGDTEQLGALVGRLTVGAIEPWPGTPGLGRILGRGMAPDAAARPTAVALANELAQLAGPG
jgi:serine/threonine protein kinase